MNESLNIGRWELSVVSGGTFRTDGGGMFGVVPKSLWSRTIECDESNLIAQDTNCLLARSDDGRVVVVDTGYGGKLGDKQRAWMHAEDGAPLLRSLESHGVAADAVTDVVLTHLHYDHAGGASGGTADAPQPTFPNARHYVQRLEWQVANQQTPELRSAYPAENLLPLSHVPLTLLDGPVDLLTGMRVMVTPGHTMGHQSVLFEGDGRTVAFLGDLCPTTRHFAILWCMAFDVDLLATRRTKMDVLGQASDQSWVVVLDHDPDHAVATVRRDDRRGFVLAQGYGRGWPE